MKRFVKTATNTSNISAKPGIMAADDEASQAFADKVSEINDQFDYIVDGFDQIDMVQANDIITRLHDDLTSYIQEIADILAQ